jgi:hypothetical protein
VRGVSIKLASGMQGREGGRWKGVGAHEELNDVVPSALVEHIFVRCTVRTGSPPAVTNSSGCPCEIRADMLERKQEGICHNQCAQYKSVEDAGHLRL